MNIIEAKQKLKKDGYTWFELEEFDINFYNQLLPIKCNNENDIKERLTWLRADVNYKTGENFASIKDEFESHQKAKEEKENLINKISNSDKFFKKQIWYYTDTARIYDLCDLDIDKHRSYVKNIIDYFYDFDSSQKYVDISNLTYYDKDCFLGNHSDGTGTGRICALLIYLNENYDENDGGILILNNTEKVVPKFGRIAMIDLQTFDIPHMVTEVTGGIGRYALLSFVKRKEDEFKHGGYNPMIN
jgi:Rps23 Pro-64 3,4-dihydroxylase Tpa1-like proline 4-hydroxylase